MLNEIAKHGKWWDDFIDERYFHIFQLNVIRLINDEYLFAVDESLS